jgi:DNA-binding LacI/PurR family transcriptional regulator
VLSNECLIKLGYAQSRLSGTEDLSIVGYNDIEIARYLSLSVVRVPVCEMGGVRHELLMARLGRAIASPGHECVQASLGG